MNAKGPSMAAVMAALEAEGHVAADRREEAAAALAGLDETQPWYLRVMTGFGAWLASLLFISFVMGVSLLATKGGYLAIGILFVGVATVVRHQLDNDFSNQTALAMSLAGQVLFAVGVSGFEIIDNLETLLLALIAANTVLIFVYPDRIHRFLSVVFSIAALIVLLYKWQLQTVLAFLAPVLAAGFVGLAMAEGRFVVRGLGELTRPLKTGLMVSAFGCVMLSTVYVLPELATAFQFYPRPWVSTLGFGLLLLGVQRLELPRMLGPGNSRAVMATYAMTLLMIVAALLSPGLVLSVLVIFLGTTRGDRMTTGAGIAFLAVFTAAFFYGIEITLLMKSLTLVATGAMVLLGRWWLLRLMETEEGNEHA